MVMALLCAGCLGLAACGGSGSGGASSSSAAESSASTASESSAASASESSAASTSESSSASAAEGSTAGSAADASAADYGDVTPEFKEFADRYVATCNKLVAVVDKAKAAGNFEDFEADWEEVSEELNALSAESKQWTEQYANGEMSDADMAYYDDVLVPAALDSASAGLEMLDLIEL